MLKIIVFYVGINFWLEFLTYFVEDMFKATEPENQEKSDNDETINDETNNNDEDNLDIPMLDEKFRYSNGKTAR